MSKTIAAALALIAAAAACGGEKPQAAPAKKPVASAPKPSHKVSRSGTQASKSRAAHTKQTKRTAAAKADTASHNPLINH